MYWLMLLAGIASPILASAQSRFQDLEPDYAPGYERPYAERPWIDPVQRPSPARTGHGEVFAPWADRIPATDAGATPEYRFRGDPPAAGGTQGADPSELRFRPLDSRERERSGPATRWRPTDEERRRDPSDPTEHSTLFDALVPDGPTPSDSWNWPP